MRGILFAIGLFALSIASANAQQFPVVPDKSVIGRIGTGSGSGPSQAVPFATLTNNLYGVIAANKVLAGPTTGVAQFPTFRLLVGADLPLPGASSLGGTFSLAAVTHQFLTSITTAGQPTQAQPACGDLSNSAASCSTDATNASNISSGTLPNARIANNSITNAQLVNVTGPVIKGLTTGTASPADLTPGQVGSILCVPVRNTFTSGTSQTYTTPTCNSVTATWLEVDVQGGGGGGASSGTGTSGNGGTTGNASSFGALTANGGGPGANGSGLTGGAGGSCSGSLGTQQNFPGMAGVSGQNVTVAGQPGSLGGVSFYGGAGAGLFAGVGGTAPVNSGGGGAGGGTSGTAAVPAPGGGSGCHIKTIITSPSATYTYTVGGTAAGGTAGTSGFAGGVGAAGLIDVVAHWQ